MKKLLLGAAVALLPITGMAATVLGFQAGTGSWSQSPSGSITSTIGSDTISGADKSEGYTYFLVEHPVPLIPNFKYATSKVDTTGNSTITGFNLDQTDATLYYEILDNVVSFDFGITARKMDGSITTAGSSTSLNGTVPLLYASAEIELPAGFSLAGEINTLSIDNNSISDVTAKINYTTDFNLGIEAGIRTQSVKVDIDNEKFDIEFDGIFAGVYFKF